MRIIRFYRFNRGVRYQLMTRWFCLPLPQCLNGLWRRLV